MSDKYEVIKIHNLSASVYRLKYLNGNEFQVFSTALRSVVVFNVRNVVFNYSKASFLLAKPEPKHNLKSALQSKFSL